MASFDYDVIIIGSGASGSVCARLLAKGGKSVAIIEAGKLGGSSANYSSIPMGALLHSAHLYQQAKNSDQLGLRGSTLGFNYPNVERWKKKAIKRTQVEESEVSLNQAGVHVIHGSAHFIDPQTITVGRARFKAKSFVVATGSEISIPAVQGLAREDFLTCKDALQLNRPPKTLAIVGAGTVGLELASLFGSFGSKVYLIEKASHLLPNEDPLVGKFLAANLKRTYSFKALLKTNLKSVVKKGVKKQLLLKSEGKLKALVVDELIMATGNVPATDIGLENAGVKYNKDGILVNYELKTTAKHILAVGACIGGQQFTHVSLMEGRIAANNILNPKKPIKAILKAIPRVTLTLPAAACVGPALSELKAAKIPVVSAAVDINIVAKANTEPAVNGFVKITAHKKTGVILSAAIVAPSASEMIQELTLAIENNLTTKSVAQTLHAFPTWSEAIRVVCSQLAKN